MTSNRETFTPETARHFDRYSVANAVAVKQSLPCGCEPYRDVFTYLRWKAQGFQVQRGQKAIKLPLVYGRTESDPETGEARTVRRVGRSAVFCRCQVKAIGPNGERVAEGPERYVIGRPIEETLCDWCGAPLYVGDTAIETSSGIYCSRACASKVAS
jgi:hypothetical protein